MTVLEALGLHEAQEEVHEFLKLRLDGNEGPLIITLGGPMSEVERQVLRYRALKRRLLESLSAKLRSGKLIALGFDTRVPLADGPHEIPPEAWTFLDLDTEEDSAEGRGFKYVGIRLFNAPQQFAYSRATRSARAAGELRRLIDEMVRSGKQPRNREALWAEARSKSRGELTRADFDRTWKAFAPTDWKRHGRKPSR